MSDYIIELRSVWKKFGSTIALSDINLCVKRGEAHLLLGPNGSGKTTLIKLIAGIIRPSSGEVRVLGKIPWKYMGAVRRRISVAFEDHSLPLWTNAYKYLKYVSSIKGVKWSDMVDLAKRLEVTSYWDKLILGYSSGMKKKIALIQALAGQPEIIMLDEPFTTLDAEARQTVLEILREKKGESTIIIASHIVIGLENLVTHCSILDNGKLLATGSISDLAEKFHVLKAVYEVDNPSTTISKLLNEGFKKLLVTGNKITVYTDYRELDKLEQLVGKPRSLSLDLDTLYQEIVTRRIVE